MFRRDFDLWTHLSELPNGMRPFQDLEPVMRAIESLDPENNTHRYYRTAYPSKSEAAEPIEQEKWLSIAEGLDYSAKVLIGYCLSEAADAALDKTKEWAKVAAAINSNSSPEIVIRFLSKAAEINKSPDPDEEVRSILGDRIKRLRVFLETAEALANILEERLQTLPTAKTDTSDDEQIIISSWPPAPVRFSKASSKNIAVKATKTPKKARTGHRAKGSAP